MSEARSPTLLRGAHVLHELDRAAANGGTILFSGGTSDVFVSGDELVRLTTVLTNWSADHGMSTVIYSPAEGTRLLGDTTQFPSHVRPTAPSNNGPAVDVPALMREIASEPRTMLILDFAESMLPRQSDGSGRSLGESIMVEEVVSRAIDPRLGWTKSQHQLVLITRTDNINANITEMPGITEYTLGLPELSERRAAIHMMLASRNHPLYLEPGLDEDIVARLTGGMTLDSLSRLRYDSDENHRLTRDMIIAEKSDIIRKLAGSTLTVYDDLRTMDDVAGLPQVRLHIQDTRLIGSSTIRVILVGPPGNGKTLVALAIARQLGVPAVAFNQIKDMWVGNSEKALTKALDVIKILAPVLVIVDEIDQTIGGSRAPSAAMELSSVESSMRDIFMEFTSDNAEDNGISIVGMSNNPEGIDTAFMSRFKPIAVLEPSSPAEMVDVVTKNTSKVKVDIDSAGLLRAFEECAQTFSGRELVNLLVSGKVYAARSGSSVVGYTEMSRAIRMAQHYSTARERRQSLSAVAFTYSSEYLPWNAAATMGETGSRPPAYLREFVRPDGTLDMSKVTAALEGVSDDF